MAMAVPAAVPTLCPTCKGDAKGGARDKLGLSGFGDGGVPLLFVCRWIITRTPACGRNILG